MFLAATGIGVPAETLLREHPITSKSRTRKNPAMTSGGALRRSLSADWFALNQP